MSAATSRRARRLKLETVGEPTTAGLGRDLLADTANLS
jgi:hypothetical protein